MEIAVYAAKNFANEETKIYKCNSVYHKASITDRESHIDLDKSSPTTLKELYEDGWSLQVINNPFSNVSMFFMEKES